jgi:hypothetical protein
MDPITAVIAAAHATGVTTELLLKAVKSYQRKVDEKKPLQLREKWRAGHLLYGQERSRVTQLLISYYQANLSQGQDALGLWYSAPDSPQRVLPLITRKNYFGQEGSRFQPVGHHVGDLSQVPRIDTEDLLEQLAILDAVGVRVWDDPLYSLHGISSTGQMNFRLTRFVLYRTQCGSLLDELALAIAKESIGVVRQRAEELLPRRAKFLPSVEALLAFEARIVAGGPAVLFVARLSDQDFGIVVQRRSYQVSDELGALSVVPKAFHQPMIDPSAEAVLEKTVYRECYEELFGGEEQHGYVDPEFYLAKCEAVRELRDPKISSLQPLGLVWDLSRGNYHPLYCLFVRSKDWWDRHHSAIRLNWEVDPELRPMVRLGDLCAVSALLHRQNWAPESYVALVEGLRWLATESEVRDSLSDIRRLLPVLRLEPLSSGILSGTPEQSP